LLPRTIKHWISHNRAADRVSRTVFSRLIGDGVATIASGPMSGLRLVCGWHVSHAHLSGIYELPTQKAIDQHVRPGFVCYDLGASIGYLSLLMARKAKKVYAFEPAPHAASEIDRHAAANAMENIEVVTLPVSGDVREVRFTLTDAAFGSAINETETRWPVLTLTTITLDMFAETHPAPDFIKIDVEGEEGRVIEGARRLLATKRPIICCELHSEEAAAHVVSVVREYRYRVQDLSGRPFVAPKTIVPGDLQVLCVPDAESSPARERPGDLGMSPG
jgi:FkbM family methyltransferase